MLANPIDMETFENVVHKWFSESIEADAIWAQQSAPRPSYPYGVLNIISGPITASPFWERKFSTDLDREAGKEILAEIGVPCTMVVSCQAHVVAADGRDPARYSRTLVSRAQARLQLISVQDDFRTANISVQRAEPVTNISGLVNDGNVSRSGIDVRFNAMLKLDEYLGYIKTTKIVSTDVGIDKTFGDV